jgi:serine-type D-Ala-D-Ala carboxypeptidase
LCHGTSLYPPPCLCYKPNIGTEPHLPRERHAFEHSRGSPTPLQEVHAGEDARFAPASRLLEQAVVERVFPGAVAAVTLGNELVYLKSFGRFTYDSGSPAVAIENIFDLASVTKVVATTSMAAILYEHGLLDLETPVAAIVPEFAGDDPRRNQITIHMLLSHSSGLPAYEKLFLKASTREQFLASAFKVPLATNPGTHAEYSDIGFIVLGVALERVADEPLDNFCQREVFGPLAMQHTTFNPPAAWRNSCVPTADDQSFRHRVIQGEVQDENAGLLGGIAGHAGLFSSARDLSVFAHVLLQGGQPIFRPETLQMFTRREASPAGTSRALGWDTPSAPSQSGRYFSASSFGHLGYTGTSLWLDPERQLSIVLLTNRTWPDCSNQAIKKVRPAFHDAVIEALQNSD